MYWTNRWNVSDARFPKMTGDPVFTGPIEFSDICASIRNNTVRTFTNFRFECRVQYPLQFADDGARFNVSLTFNGK